MYIRNYEALGQPPEEVIKDFEEQKRRFEMAKALHQQRLAPLPLDILPLQVLSRAGLRTTTRVGPTTASLIQTALERSRVLRPHIGSKLRRTTVSKEFVIHSSDEEFNGAYSRLHRIVIPFGSPEEKDLIKKRGFYHFPTRTIHLRPGSNIGHALHEAIHKYASPAFRGLLGSFLDEGVTQYFTNLVLQEQGLDPMMDTYQDQLGCANRLVNLFSQGLVARSYFQGDLGLVHSIVRRLNINVAGLHPLRKSNALCQRLASLRP